MRRINIGKVNQYVEEDMITEFDSVQEMLDYLNYNCPEIDQEMKNLNDVKDYFQDYYFAINNTHYLIAYDECLDIYK